MRKLILLAILLVSIPVTAADSALQLERYQGSVVLVDFWASWCVPCRRSFPWMNAMQAKYADAGLVILAVNLDQTPADAETFLAKYPAEFEIVYDPMGDLAREFGVEVMPSSFLVGRDGEITDRHAGFKVQKEPEYEAQIKTALNLENVE